LGFRPGFEGWVRLAANVPTLVIFFPVTIIISIILILLSILSPIRGGAIIGVFMI
jgi:hypothetical protein